MRRFRVIVLVLFLAVAVVIPAFAKLGDAAKARIENDLRSKSYVAKVDLYDVTVFPDGTVDSEYDKEAVKSGQKILIKKVAFSKKAIEIELSHPFFKKKTVRIDFFFEVPLSPDFKQEEEQWNRMIGAIFVEEGKQE